MIHVNVLGLVLAVRRGVVLLMINFRDVHKIIYVINGIGRLRLSFLWN